MRTNPKLIKRQIPQGFCALVLVFVLGMATAHAGVSIRTYVGYGLYPYGAIDVSTTMPGTGLLSNNGSSRALVQLIYAGADLVINEVDLDNSAEGYVSGDDVVWQSTTLEWGVNDVDEWGFTSTLPVPYTDLAWSTAGFTYVRAFQDDTPQSGEGYYDSSILALDTGISSAGSLPQTMAFGSSSNAGAALNHWIPQTTSIVRTLGPGELDLMSVPLYVSPTNTFGIITTNAGPGSVVYFYNSAISNFSKSVKSGKGWATAVSNRIVLPGESFFLEAPSDATNEISITGTVPYAPITNQVHERWSAFGYPFPVAVTWTDTSLSSNLPAGTLAYFWNRNNQEYEILLKGPPAKGGWGTEGSNRVIQPGDGFFVRQPLGSSAFEWVVQP